MKYLKIPNKDYSNFHPDKKELALGIKEEEEHSSNKVVQKQTAFDHLKEKPGYYTKLKKCMNTKTAFEIGFIKSACEAGLTEGQAIDLIKVI